MPANHKVSVAWQIVFTFLPIVNFWAFYRVRKLLKYLLYVFVPSIALSIVFGYFYSWGVVEHRSINPSLTSEFDGPVYEPAYLTLDPTVAIPGSIIGFGLQGFAIYLVIIWSRQHNQKFETQPPSG